ncbi:SprT family protein [Aquibacillus albus]|uniref:Protein SprT-like n=1 Tax=Aquibacillus albus TaxID=1168171 RepID=A0ABS2MYV2_9BACI|nr:SprT family protein [Aquibacillus albus]MBM7571069.1 SprT-like protein [Aquibacillus albus]
MAVLMTQEELEQLVDELSSEFFGKRFVDTVAFNPRLRTTGGRYIPAKRRIELNPKYLVELGEAEFRGIIKHELCHYHLHIEGKGYNHRDKTFKDLLKATGSPRHCQPLPSTRGKYKYTYVCIGCGQAYNRKRFVNVSRYRCGKCNGKLKQKDSG